MNNRRKTLPPVDPSTDPKLRPILEAIKEMQETGEGVRGDPLDRKLTLRDMVDSGLASLRNGSKSEIGPVEDDPIDNDVPDSTLIPPRPTGFNAIGSFGYIVLSWDIPKDLYLNHAYTSVYRAESDNFANAEMIGRDTGMMYTDHIREVEEHGVGFYYWITFTSTEDVEGPANSAGGTYAEVIPDLGFLLDRLSGEINEDVLTPAFQNRLDGFQETISELGDRYTLSVNNNGHVAGFTIYNTGKQSDFAVLADRFSIANRFGAERHPFIVVGGDTYIDTAFIREASIQEGQLGPIGFGKITDQYGRSVTTVAGKLKGELIEAENLSVAEAAKFYGNVYSSNYRSGLSGWAIYQSGNFELNQGQIRSSVQIGNTTMGDIAQSASSIDDWRRPGSTLIDGNKIYAADAYVDTLQIKGQAVTIPASVQRAGSSSFSTNWATAVELYFNPEGGRSTVIVSAGYEARSYSLSAGGSSTLATLTAEARILYNGREVYRGEIGKNEARGENGSNANALIGGTFASSYLTPPSWSTQKMELQFRISTHYGDGVSGNMFGRTITSISTKR